MDNAKEFGSRIATILEEPQHKIPADEARTLVRQVYPRTDVDEDGKLHVRLATGIRVPATESAARMIASELFTKAMAPQAESDVDRIVEQKRQSGHFTGL